MGSRRALRALAVALALVAIACPNASGPVAGVPAGDVSMAGRLLAVHLAAVAALWAEHHGTRRAALEWIAVGLPAWTHLSFFPDPLAPLALAPFGVALLRAESAAHRCLLAGLCAAAWMLGGAGWIFHYFDRPLLPSLIALGVALALWLPACLLVAVTLERSARWLPLAAAFWPATEWVRGSWLEPPLPGLFIAHANADGELARLATRSGELGVSYLVSLLALGAALAWLRAPTRVRPFALSAIAIAGLAAGASPTPDPESAAGTRVCAVADPKRHGRDTAPFSGGGDAALRALSRSAVEQHGCELTLLPEYSLALSESDLITRDEGRRRPPSPPLLGGASVSRRDERGRTTGVRNVVCRLHPDGIRGFVCADPLDKLIFAPIGEVALFRGTQPLDALGQWLWRHATDAPADSLHHTFFAPRVSGTVEIEGREVGAALCWEVLVPSLFERRGIRRREAALLVVLSDLGGFGDSREAIEQFRRAARHHAMRLETPIVFAGTHGAFLIDADGRTLRPLTRDAFFTVWDVPLRAPVPPRGAERDEVAAAGST